MSERLSPRPPATELEAYLAGLLVADACLVHERGRPMAINLTQSRKHGTEIMHRLAVEYSRPLHREVRDTNYGPKDQLTLQFRCIPFAWLAAVPDMESSLLRHYWRGYVDGDGCVDEAGRTYFFHRIDQQWLRTQYLEWLLALKFPPITPIFNRTSSSHVLSIFTSDRDVARALYYDSTIYKPFKRDRVR